MKIPGSAIKTERERRGWTQSELGLKIRASQHTISRIESDSVIHPKWISRFDHAFGGEGWRSLALLREDEPRYTATLEQKLDRLTKIVERLVEDVDVLKGTRRSLRK